MIYPLIDPVEIGSLRVTELNFREVVKAKDWKGIPMRDPMLFDDMLTIAGRLCGQSDLVMGELTSQDMCNIITLVSGFLSNGPAPSAKTL